MMLRRWSGDTVDETHECCGVAAGGNDGGRGAAAGIFGC